MEKVRFPIIREDNMPTRKFLEVDVAYFTTGPGRHYGNVVEVPMSDWEKTLIANLRPIEKETT